MGLERLDVTEIILNKPVLSSYSAKRDIAVIDIGRKLESEGFDVDDLFQIYLRNNTKSPYVPESNRRRISQVENGKEPPLLITIRKSLKYKKLHQ